MFNAFQPGVFALSGWDLRGVMTLPTERIGNLLEDGDTRWIGRGAYDLMGVNPEASESLSSMPKALALYPSLPEQLQDKQSFASHLKRLLTVREAYHLATAKQLEIPAASDSSVLVMVHRLTPVGDQPARIQATVLNFSQQAVSCTVRSAHFLPGASYVDALDETTASATVNSKHTISLTLQPNQGRCLIFTW